MLTRLNYFLLLIFIFSSVFSQKKRIKKLDKNQTPISYNKFEWRNIGPFRGGRSVCSTGVIGEPGVFYMGVTGGGVWKTNNNGVSWKNISDGYLNTGSVGALAVSESDPNVVYAGMGEACIRPVMTSHGDGVYRSNNGGETWAHTGLDNSRTISSLVIHPKDHNLVYVGVQGDQYKPSKDRGVYRSFDGGENWENTLYINNKSLIIFFSLINS